MALPPTVSLGEVTLAVADLKRSLTFYVDLLGLRRLGDSNGSAVVGSDDQRLIRLVERPGARRQPRNSTGLYHVAILLPSRADLARLIIHLAQQKFQLSGYADHLVSEAFYLNDPDGNGLELYRDRPRSEWPMLDGGMVRMDNAPIDFDDFFATAEREGAVWAGMPAGTTVGHMHLKVGNADAARDFYRDVIGFDVMAYFPGAAFVSAGGYHHHLGMNHWESRGASAPPDDSVGLVEWTVLVPDKDALEGVASRAEAVNALDERGEDFARIHDTWGTSVRLKLA